MRKIRIDQIEVGMVLAAPVIGEGGNMLLGAGATLSPSMVARLKNWGIAWIQIASEENEQAAPKPGADQEKVDREMRQRFKKVMDDPIMQSIFQITKKHMLSK